MSQRVLTPPSPVILSRSARRRRGFSMIEILVVIGILLILMAIGVVGYRSLDQSTSKRATETVLNNAQSLMAEYEAAGNPSRTLAEKAGIGSPVSSPGDVTPGAGGRYGSQVAKTQQVMGLLMQIPRNKEMVTALPTKSLMTENVTSGSLKTVQSGTDKRVDPPVLLDGWRNPIIFVPTGGISVGNGGVVKSPDGKPFWVSAGPDGTFSFKDQRDDNVYSFRK